MEKIRMGKNIWLDGMMGLVVGDALGVPVQFLSRDKIKNRPKGLVTGMESGGFFNMPEGSWSDDSSMALATLVSIKEKNGVDPYDIMTRFVEWETKGMYTPFGRAFDQGITCTDAIYRFMESRDIASCGATGEYANGNGALMRILPVCLYYYERQKKVCTSEDEAVESIHIVSGLTHNHIRGKICCGIYYFMVKSILDAAQDDEKHTLEALLQDGIDKGLSYYGRDLSNLSERAHLERLFTLSEFRNVPEEKIKSSGYVIDSIEAAVWCLINSGSYKECMLKAVNLGEDTDTVAAIAGGLAGLYYGYEAIPGDWLSVIRKREWIEEICL
ncbi:MAG: ADP-ribosylglycohydrolase family protein [Lachnospiraceae bacterium]|nr:ADP-ribosylglycohydrolase family protein [Lachnospiraceae bacterium]